MSATQSRGVERRSEQADVTEGFGWVLFAGAILALLAMMNFIYGLAAVGNSKVFIGDAKYVISDLNTWGWVLLAVSLLQIVAAGGIWAQVGGMRWVGVAIAAVNAVVQLIAMPAYPAWSILLFALDVLVIYALIVHGGREKCGTARARRSFSGAPGRRRSDGRGVARFEDVTQPGLGVVVERGLDDLAAELGDLGQHLVRRAAVHERDQRRAARFELGAELLHELVVDADVGQRPGRGARGRADRHADQRDQEDQADQAAPQRAAGRAAGHELVRLMQLDLAVLLAGDDHRVVELDRVLGLEAGERAEDLLRGRLIWIGDGDQCAHRG